MNRRIAVLLSAALLAALLAYVSPVSQASAQTQTAQCDREGLMTTTVTNSDGTKVGFLNPPGASQCTTLQFIVTVEYTNYGAGVPTTRYVYDTKKTGPDWLNNCEYIEDTNADTCYIQPDDYRTSIVRRASPTNLGGPGTITVPPFKLITDRDYMVTVHVVGWTADGKSTGSSEPAMWDAPEDDWMYGYDWTHDSSTSVYGPTKETCTWQGCDNYPGNQPTTTTTVPVPEMRNGPPRLATGPCEMVNSAGQIIPCPD